MRLVNTPQRGDCQEGDTAWSVWHPSLQQPHTSPDCLSGWGRPLLSPLGLLRRGQWGSTGRCAMGLHADSRISRNPRLSQGWGATGMQQVEGREVFRTPQGRWDRGREPTLMEKSQGLERWPGGRGPGSLPNYTA